MCSSILFYDFIFLVSALVLVLVIYSCCTSERYVLQSTEADDVKTTRYLGGQNTKFTRLIGPQKQMLLVHIRGRSVL